MDSVTRFLSNGLSELRPALEPVSGDDPELVLDHPFLDLWHEPNPYHTIFHTLTAVVKNAADTGHSFIIIGLDERNMITTLTYAPSQSMQMLVEEDGGWPVGWRYFTGGRVGFGAYVDIPASRVVHIMWEIDPINTRGARGAGQVLALDVAADSLARDWTASQLDNGVAGVGITLPYDMTDAQQQKKADLIQQRLGLANKGKPVVMPGGATFDRVGATARDLQMRELSRLPEERICSVLGVPAMAVGLGAGLDRSTFTNYRQALRAGMENGVLPLSRLIAEAVTRQLLRQIDFDPFGQYRFVFDASKVAVLQEAMGEFTDRIIAQWQATLIDKATAKEALGYKPEPGDVGDYYEPPAAGAELLFAEQVEATA